MALRFLTVVVLGAALLGACGDDDDKGGTKDAGTDAGPVDKKDAAMPPETIMCKAKECMPPEIMLPDGFMVMGFPVTPALLEMFGFAPQVCCAGENEDVCGVTQPTLIPSGDCLEQNQLGRPAEETECPAQSTSIMGAALPLTGCCRADNKCGVDLGILGVGCLDNETFNSIGMMGGGAAGMIDASIPMLEAKSCVYEPVSGNDAGTEDAGR